jgi:MFS family permease
MPSGIVSPTPEVDAGRRSILTVELAPGITGRNLLSLLFCGIAAFSLVSFVNLLQPYLLTEHLALAKNMQGRITGRLFAMQEGVALVLAGMLGIASDRIGRDRLFSAGLVIVGAGLLSMPLAGSVETLFGARFILAVGAACIAATFNGLVADAPANRSRGRLLLLLGITQQITILVLVSNVGARLPQWLRAAGLDAVTAGRIVFWGGSLLAFAGAWLAFSGLPRIRAAMGDPDRKGTFLSAVRMVLSDARRDPRLRLVFPAAIVARGDVAIAGLFLPLWISTAGAAKGIPAAKAVAWAGTVFTGMSVAAFIGTLIGGWLADRIDRVLLVRIGFALGTFTYLAVLLVPDPFADRAVVLAGLIGVSEMVAIMAGQALLGEAAPIERRGAVAGLFSTTGSAIVLIGTWLGGELFDRLGPSAPFVLMGSINLFLLGYALTVPLRGERE